MSATLTQARHIIRASIALVLFVGPWASAATTADVEFPMELVNFEPYANNPVFTARGNGHWDVRIRERGWILREGSAYHMWFTGYDGTQQGLKKLGYATSLDGLKWMRHADNPICSNHWVEDVNVVKQGDTYYMFAEGLGDQSHLLSSKDRVHWKRQGQLDVRNVDGRPIDPGPYGTPTAWYEDMTWYLFYERSDLGVWLATSKNMIVWTNLQDEPVLRPGPSSCDKDFVALNQIIKYKGRYYAYYHGAERGNTPRLWTTNVATSTDLRHWKKYPANPLQPAKENKSSGLLVHDGQQFRLYTMHEQVHVHFPARMR